MSNLAEQIFPLEEIREISLRKAKEILSEIGIEGNHKFYAIKQYELQFRIYHAIKHSLEMD